MEVTFEMLKKYLAILVVALGAAPLFADVELQTSINDVFNRGSAELAGSITMTVNDDDFTNASTLEPVFIRVTPDHSSRLAETLVDQSLPATDYRRIPVFLAMELNTTGGALSMAALTESVSIVRWVQGESAFWLRVQSDSDNWIRSVTGALAGPNEDQLVSWALGISARSSAADNTDWPAKSNLPFNTRDPLTAGDPADATSTLLCVDLSTSELATSGQESLLRYDIISFDYRADLGGGVYNGQAGNPTGIDFTNDFFIARGKSRSCSVTPGSVKFEVDPVPLCVPAAVGNTGTIAGLVKATNIINFTITCQGGGNLLDTDLFNGAYISFATGSRAAYGFLAGSATFGSVNSEGVFTPNANGWNYLSGSFDSHGQTLYSNVDLVWAGGTQTLVNFPMTIQVCTYYYFSDPPVDIVLDWGVTLVNHDGAEDDAPYDGPDQHRRCDPSEFDIYEDVWNFGSYVPCAGVPTVLFFPYLPKTFDSSFWVGLSYVNQGTVDFEDGDIETIFYSENGDRFVGVMPALPENNQMTWVLREDSLGTVGLIGAGENNLDVVVVPSPSDPAVPADSFGVTRMSMFVTGSFEAEFINDIFDGDLDGYLLIGSSATGSVDGAYLPRNYDNDVTGQDADLPLNRNKRVSAGTDLPINSDSAARHGYRDGVHLMNK
jgi:hypothetical protein